MEYKKGQEIKKKYVTNINQTFYKLKPKINKQKDRKMKVRSERTSYKFLPILQETEDEDVQVLNVG